MTDLTPTDEDIDLALTDEPTKPATQPSTPSPNQLAA